MKNPNEEIETEETAEEIVADVIDRDALQIDTKLDNAFEDSAFSISPELFGRNRQREIEDDFEQLCDGTFE